MAARMAVVVVPIFEPRHSGYALSILMTPMPIELKTTWLQYIFSHPYTMCLMTITICFTMILQSLDLGPDHYG